MANLPSGSNGVIAAGLAGPRRVKVPRGPVPVGEHTWRYHHANESWVNRLLRVDEVTEVDLKAELSSAAAAAAVAAEEGSRMRAEKHVAQPAACGAEEQKIDPKWREYGQADDVITIAQVSERRIATAQRAREEVVLRRLRGVPGLIIAQEDHAVRLATGRAVIALCAHL